MLITPLSLRSDYWENFEIQEKDLDDLYNHLLEIEEPLTPLELARAVIEERIRVEKKALESQQQAEGTVYVPKDHYQPGQTLLFPALDWKKGKVTGVRQGNNPEVGAFDVIEVQINGEKREFASGIGEHRLNQPVKSSWTIRC
jgi:hypothetical protein